MNNENNFNNNDLPKINDNENNQSNQNNQIPTPPLQNEVRPQIEIPQAYYDQKKALEEAKAEEEKQNQIRMEEQKQNSIQSGNLIITLLVFGVLTFGCIYFMLNKTELAPVIMLGIIVIASIISGVKNKKKSNIPDGILAGGIICAAVTFVISMVKKDQSDLWTYYALASGIIAIVGYIISKLITTIIVNGKNIKAVQTIGIFLVFAAIIVTPIYFKEKYPEEFARIVLRKTREIVAESEEDFVTKTLKNRYGKEFTCGNKKTAMDYVLHKMVSRYMCVDEKLSNTELQARLKNASYDTETNTASYITVTSIPYNENELQFIIEDNYLDNLYLDKVKKSISDALAKKIPNSTFKISLYPNGNCLFVGDCVDCDEYFAVADEEEKLDVRFSTSTKLDYAKELKLTPIDFINNHEYKVIVNIIGYYSTYAPENHEPTTASAIAALNELGLKNNYGFEIILKNSTEYNKEAYKVVGERSDDKTFKNPKEIQLYDPVETTPEGNNSEVTNSEETPNI